ncbi:hypothetical protein PISL3812_06339 [Talaromyces islandicus]|uniref:Zn(2)-C6 fungal-type domain-containing protein n=1 Tax=Talaromyces islandicus TaxID=28573 RepID=A0A0U1M190_TALIS|nr:hypothetical protein PISL3812_06339 [Talaromyces islandicus]
MASIAGDSTTAGGHMRQRSRYACAPCRQRKRKCDGKYPCSTCTGYGYDCQYNGVRGGQDNNAASSSSNYHSPPSPQGTKRKSPAADLDEPPTPTNFAPKTRPHASLLRRGFGEEVVLLKEDRPSTNGFLVPCKGRFIGRHSAVAFPQWVGTNLQSACPPRVHSFAYNTGVRRELSYSVTFKLDKYVTWAEVHDSINVYENVIHPVFGFIDIEYLRRRSHYHWHGKPQGPNFEAQISGIVALASLFSQVLCENRELRVVQHAKDVLDDPAIARFPTLDTMSAWILRTIYSRSTSRPGITWQYSCTMMHLCENIGASRQPETSSSQTADAEKRTAATTVHEDRDFRARLAIVARCLHVFISYEHGRSTVEIGPIPEHSVIHRKGDLTMQLNALINALPPDSRSHHDQLSRRQELCTALSDLLAAPTDHEYLTLIKADLCFCVYRRLRLLDLGLKQDQLEQVIRAGKMALPAARILVLRNHPWWNTVGSVFQYLCVLLAIDNSDSIAAIPEAMETLETITKHLRTHLADEALNTARLLVRAMKEKKRKEFDNLDRIAGITSLATDSLEDNNNNNMAVNEEAMGADQLLQQQQQWSGMIDFTDPMWNWDAFFEPFAEQGLLWTSGSDAVNTIN